MIPGEAAQVSSPLASLVGSAFEYAYPLHAMACTRPDQSAGPVRVQVETMPAGRHWSLAFMDAFTNHFAIVGQRSEGQGPVTLRVRQRRVVLGGRAPRRSRLGSLSTRPDATAYRKTWPQFCCTRWVVSRASRL